MVPNKGSNRGNFVEMADLIACEEHITIACPRRERRGGGRGRGKGKLDLGYSLPICRMRFIKAVRTSAIQLQYNEI